MRAFIQKHGEVPANINVYNAWHGFDERGWEISFFQTAEVDSLKLEPGDVLVGGGGTVQRALRVMGCPQPYLSYFPPRLTDYVGRRVWTATLGEVRRMVSEGVSVFIKPTEKEVKLFAGHLVGSLRDLLQTSGWPDEQPVTCSEPVEFISEYRVFVLKGEIAGCKHYKGDYRIHPGFETIDAAVASYIDAPAAYAIDFGATSDGRTLLVEANDAYSLGSYGLGSVTYSRLIEARWIELSESAFR